jgi:hypothetical protein
MILYSADRGIRADFSARSTISGPMPAESPSVMPMRGLRRVLVLLIASYLIEHEHDYEHEQERIVDPAIDAQKVRM